MRGSIASLARWRRIAFIIAVAVTAAIGVVMGRAPILRALGSTLVAEDPLMNADAIAITIDAGASGVLEAADLVHAGVSRRVAIFGEAPDAVDAEFIRRGFKYESQTAVWRRMLNALGVSSVEEIPVTVTGTSAEGSVLPRWCEQQHLESVILVTTPDHSYRMKRVIHRAMRGHATRIIVRPARVSSFDPNVWWLSRSGMRTGIVELEKLTLDLVRHPFQ